VDVATDTAFEVLFREEYPRLVAIGVALTSSQEVAKDLAQETMARAYHAWSEVRSADSTAGWLRVVMKNLVVDHYRREASRGRAVSRLSNHRSPDPDAELGNVDAATAMLRMLEVLPERQRISVALRYVDDLSIGEIADTLGVAAGTVGAALWKARRTLERFLESEAFDDS
jgi:RNA polymerase sigma factor (sigma-70 family)